MALDPATNHGVLANLFSCMGAILYVYGIGISGTVPAVYLAYQASIVMGYKRAQGLSWVASDLAYDAVFQRKAAAAKSLLWLTVDSSGPVPVHSLVHKPGPEASLYSVLWHRP